MKSSLITSTIFTLACVSNCVGVPVTVNSRHAAVDYSHYALGKEMSSCDSTCMALGKSCIPHVETDNTEEVFAKLGVKCNKTAQKGDWWAPDQPSVVVDITDPNAGDCLGFVNVPNLSDCAAFYPSVKRVCNCGGPSCDDLCWPENSCGKKICVNASSKQTFGTGLSGGGIDATETTLFAHVLAKGAGDTDTAVMNHFWSTCSPECERSLVVRYYIDGEANASIEFHPAMMAGTGFDDDTAPWGTKWIGLGAGKGGGQAWYNNFKIPFETSVRITIQSSDGKSYNGFYMIVRGGLLNTPLTIGDVALPPNAKLQLQKFEGPMQPLEVLNIVSVPKGMKGQFFMSALAVNNEGVGGLNFLEGCYHMYDPADEPFPGTLLSTGTEDFFDSGWYFNAGEFRFPVSGFTHLLQNKTRTEWSAYRFHEMDPLRFSDGLRITWRCGDLAGHAANGGGKCFTQDPSQGHPVGSPTCDNVISYAWVYVWN
eukprot:m.17442 g.17442  ORF g.17442 m.17442 type:complete len:482 (-) comp11512_c0_seq1:40-1485(-)